MGIRDHFTSVHADFVRRSESSGDSIGADHRHDPVSRTTTTCMLRTCRNVRLDRGLPAPRSWSLLLSLFLLCLGAHAVDRQTVLDSYVKARDIHYRYQLVDKKR